MGKQLIQLAKLALLITTLLITPYKNKAGAQMSYESKPFPEWATTTAAPAVHGCGERKTELHFYLHEIFSTNNSQSATAVRVVPPPQPGSATGFGSITVFDDPLRVGPDPNSKMVGRAQGMGAAASREEITSLLSFTFTFSDGMFNGSSLSCLGLIVVTDSDRKFPVVGGTGIFQLARGYALGKVHTLDLSTGVIIVQYNVTVYY